MLDESEDVDSPQIAPKEQSENILLFKKDDEHFNSQVVTMIIVTLIISNSERLVSALRNLKFVLALGAIQKICIRHQLIFQDPPPCDTILVAFFIFFGWM